MNPAYSPASRSSVLAPPSLRSQSSDPFPAVRLDAAPLPGFPEPFRSQLARAFRPASPPNPFNTTPRGSEFSVEDEERSAARRRLRSASQAPETRDLAGENREARESLESGEARTTRGAVDPLMAERGGLPWSPAWNGAAGVPGTPASRSGLSENATGGRGSSNAAGQGAEGNAAAGSGLMGSGAGQAPEGILDAWIRQGRGVPGEARNAVVTAEGKAGAATTPESGTTPEGAGASPGVGTAAAAAAQVTGEQALSPGFAPAAAAATVETAADAGSETLAPEGAALGDVAATPAGEAGTGSAELPSDMERMLETAGTAEAPGQNLPGAGGDPGFGQGSTGSNGESDGQGQGHGAETAGLEAAMHLAWQGAGTVAWADATPGMGQASDRVVGDVEPTERLMELMRTAVERIRQTSEGEYRVELRPDPETELVLRITTRGGEAEVEAELRRGDVAAFAGRWQELQERLADQGVRLAAWRSEGAGGRAPGDSGQAGFGSRSGGRGAFAEEESRRGTGSVGWVEGDHPVPAPGVGGRVRQAWTSRGWETWA